MTEAASIIIAILIMVGLVVGFIKAVQLTGKGVTNIWHKLRGDTADEIEDKKLRQEAEKLRKAQTLKTKREKIEYERKSIENDLNASAFQKRVEGWLLLIFTVVIIFVVVKFIEGMEESDKRWDAYFQSQGYYNGQNQ